MALPLAIGVAVAAAVFGLPALSWPAARLAAIAAAAAMVLFGWPALFWTIDTGRTGPIARSLTGALIGVTPFAAAVLSGLIGTYARSNDVEHVRWVLEHGAPVPYFGTTPWHSFLWLLTLGILCGVVTLWTAAAIESRTFRRVHRQA